MTAPNDRYANLRGLSPYYAGGSDPSVKATYGEKGAVYTRIGAVGISNVWVKNDNGKTTNWSPLGAGGGGGANQNLSNLLAPTAVNQDLIMNVGKTLILPYNTYLKSKDLPGTGTRDLIKTKVDATMPTTYISQLGQRTQLVNDAGGPFDFSANLSGTYRGIFSWLNSTRALTPPGSQTLRALQGSADTSGGSSGQTIGVYGTTSINAGTTSINSATGVRAFTSINAGSAGQIFGFEGYVFTQDAATNITSMKGIFVNCGNFAGTVTRMIGAHCNVDNSGAAIANNMYGFMGEIYPGNGNVNYIGGDEVTISPYGTFTGAGDIVGRYAGIEMSLGTVTGQITGANSIIRTSGTFVSANEINGFTGYINWAQGNVTQNIAGVNTKVVSSLAAGAVAGGLWGADFYVSHEAGSAGEVVGTRSTTRILNSAVTNDYTGLKVFHEVDAAFAGTIGNLQTAVFGYDVRCNIPGGGSRAVVVSVINDYDGDAPQHVYRVYNTGFTNRTAANPLLVAFGLAGVLNDAAKTFSHGLDLYMGVPFRTCDIQMAMGAQIKNAVAGEIDVGANQLKNLVNGSANQDAVTVAQLNAAIGGEGTKEVFTMVGGGLDLFIDIANIASTDSISIDWWQNGHLVESIGGNTFDYNVNYAGVLPGQSRINFEALLTAALSAGDKIIVQYEHI